MSQKNINEMRPFNFADKLAMTIIKNACAMSPIQFRSTLTALRLGNSILIQSRLCPTRNSHPLSLGMTFALNRCRALILAKEAGLVFSRYGLDVTLCREFSWANLRDKLVVGLLMPQPIACPTAMTTALGAGGSAASSSLLALGSERQCHYPFQ